MYFSLKHLFHDGTVFFSHFWVQIGNSYEWTERTECPKPQVPATKTMRMHEHAYAAEQKLQSWGVEKVSDLIWFDSKEALTELIHVPDMQHLPWDAWKWVVNRWYDVDHIVHISWSQISFQLTMLIFHCYIFVSKPLPNSYNFISAFGNTFNKIAFCRSEIVPKQCNSEKQHRGKEKNCLEKLVKIGPQFSNKTPQCIVSCLLFSLWITVKLNY